MAFVHQSVLLMPAVEALAIRPDGIYLDGTLGGAGHSYEIASRLTTGRLIGLDRDEVALAAARERLKPFSDRVTLVHSNFQALSAVLDDLGIAKVDGMLFDLGVSSPQLDDKERGFSYMADAPLDMRMDRSEGLTAYDVVNTYDQESLKRILYTYGEERYAPKIAAAIVKRRAEKPIETTLELAELIRAAMPPQALREKQHRQRRAHRRGADARLGHRPPQSRRAPGGDYLPLPGGSPGEVGHAGGGQGLHLPEGISRVCLRENAKSQNSHPPPHRRRRGRAGGKSPRQKRQAPGGGTDLRKGAAHGKRLAGQRTL